MVDSVVCTRGLRCNFPRQGGFLTAVDCVDMEIVAGEVLGLVGESGSGKSTLGRVIAGLQTASGGDMIIDGKHCLVAGRTVDKPAPGVVQMVFQDSFSCLNPRLKIIDSLFEPLRATGHSRADARRSALQWLDRVELPESAAERFPHELSGGQRQRIGIARAFSVEPRLVICDEAVSALDVSVQAQVLALLADIRRENAAAMLFISHDLAVVRHLVDRVAVMYQGEIVESGPVGAVYAAPQHPYTRALLSLHMDLEPGESAHRSKPSHTEPLRTALPLSSDRGCRYSLRCEHKQPDCEAAPCALRKVLQEHQVACHRWASIAHTYDA